MIKMLLIITLSSLSCMAQDKKDKHGDITLLNKAEAVYQLIYSLKLNDKIKWTDTLNPENKRIFKEAINLKKNISNESWNYYNKLIKEYPKSKLYLIALNEKAEIEFENQDFIAARETYNQIMVRIINKDDFDRSGISAESYSNYMYNIAKNLSDIEYNAKNYQKAISYLKLTDKYPYEHFCGNAFASQQLSIAEMYAKNYLAMNNSELALDYLLPLMFFNLFEDNSDLVILTAKALKVHYGNEKARQLFNDAKNSLEHRIEKGNEYAGNHDYYLIKLKNTDIEVFIPDKVYLASNTFELNDKMVLDYIDKSLISRLLNE